MPRRAQRDVALSVGRSADYFADMRQRGITLIVLLFLFEGVAEEALRRDDWALLRAWMRDPGALALHRITGAGHWIPLDAPDELATLLVDFLG